MLTIALGTSKYRSWSMKNITKMIKLMGNWSLGIKIIGYPHNNFKMAGVRKGKGSRTQPSMRFANNMDGK